MIKEYDDIIDEKVLISCFICNKQKQTMLTILRQEITNMVDDLKLGTWEENYICFGCFINKILKDKLDIV